MMMTDYLEVQEIITNFTYLPMARVCSALVLTLFLGVLTTHSCFLSLAGRDTRRGLIFNLVLNLVVSTLN